MRKKRNKVGVVVTSSNGSSFSSRTKLQKLSHKRSEKKQEEAAQMFHRFLYESSTATFYYALKRAFLDMN